VSLEQDRRRHEFQIPSRPHAARFSRKKEFGIENVFRQVPSASSFGLLSQQMPSMAYTRQQPRACGVTKL
jgi:hypothetical protein